MIHLLVNATVLTMDDSLPVAQAQEFIARLVPRVQAVEMLALRSALGRVLAHDIVERHDGLIQVKSMPGFGTLVSIWLPSVASRISSRHAHGFP